MPLFKNKKALNNQLINRLYSFIIIICTKHAHINIDFNTYVVFCPGVAWLVIPRTYLIAHCGWLDFQSWRLFVVLCSVPSLSSALVFRLLMPESPKFLMEVRTD